MEDLVSFEIAKKLKEKGFREECLCHYIDSDIVYNLESPIANNQMWFCHNKYDNIWHRDNVDAPTISQVLKWLREENIILSINPSYFKGDYCFGWDCDIWVNANYNHRCVSDNSYEQAALAGIEYVLDNLIENIK